MSFCISAPNAVVVPRCAGVPATRTSAMKLTAPLNKATSTSKLGFAQSNAVRIQSTSTRSRAAPMRTGVYAQLSTASVKIAAQGKNFEMTDAIRAHTEEKLGHAVQPFEESAGVREVDVKFSARGGQDSLGPKIQTIEITVYSKKGVFRVEESDSNLYSSIDKAADTLSRKLRKTKEKRNDKKGHASGADLAEDGVDDVFNKTAELPAEEVKTVYVEFPTFSVAEAVKALEITDTGFFAFKNKASGNMNIIYKDGGGFRNLVPME